MRILFIGAALVLTAMSLWGGKKVISPNTSAGNDQVDIIATITIPEEEVTQVLGVDPGKGIALLKVKVVPKTDKPVQVSPEDFILLAHDDGERSKPFEPSEIAGQGALIVSDNGTAVKKVGSSIGFGGIMGGSGSSPGNSRAVSLSSKMDPKSQGNAKLPAGRKAQAEKSCGFVSRSSRKAEPRIRALNEVIPPC